MKQILATLFSGVLISLAAPSYCQNIVSAGTGRLLWKAGQDNFPGNIKAFVENKGQYDNSAFKDKGEVLYTYNYNGITVLFAQKGIIYAIPETSKTVEPEKEQKRSNGNETETIFKTVLHYIVMEWENTNGLPEVEATEPTPFTFGAMSSAVPGKGIDHMRGYRKITYRNLYPGTDIEFSFAQNGGIKYCIRASTGAAPTTYKIRYMSPDQELDSKVNQAGELVVQDKKLSFEITDAAPTALQEGKRIPCSFAGKNSEFSFFIPRFNPEQPVLIDPLLTIKWQNTTFPVTGFSAYDLAMDQANNTYVFGVDNAMQQYVQQYGLGGSLNWTYALTQYSIVSFRSSVSDMVCDRTGNTYIPSPFEYRTMPNQWAMISLYPNGALHYFDSNTNASIFETWNIAYSCNYSMLIQSGASSFQQNQLSAVTPSNGSLNTVTVNPGIGEIYAGCFASNGYYYCLGAYCPSGGNNLACYDVSSGSPNLRWKKSGVLAFSDYSFKYNYKIPTNGIASGCGFLYTSDGDSLQQRDLTNGNIIHSVVIPGGSNSVGSVNSGIATDNCGNVYAGSQGAIYIYDQNLNPLGSYTGLPGIVLDVKYSNGVLTACGANSTFVVQFTTNNCNAITTTSSSTSCNGNSGTATANPPSLCGANPPFSYLWMPGGQTGQTATGLAPGSYTVAVTDASCPPVYDSAIVIVAGEPGFSATETHTFPACNTNNGSIQLFPTGGTPPYAYTWSNGATTQNISGLSAGTYSCIIRDNAGCTFLIGATLSTLPPPPITVTPPVGSICKNGGSVALQASGASLYTWKPSTGLSCTYCANPVASPSVSTTYTVIGTDGGCKDSTTVSVQIINVPKTFYFTYPDSCLGATEVHIYDSTYSPGLTYSWAPATGVSCSTCYYTYVSPTVTTVYTVTVTDQGCSDTMMIKINPIPAYVTLNLTATSYTVCSGDSTLITATPSNSSISYWQWTPFYSYCYKCNTIKVAPTVTTTYYVNGYDSVKRCWVYDSITIHVFKPVPVSGYSDICRGSFTTLSAGGALNYQWSTGATTSSITVYPTNTTTYYVIESDNGCSDTMYYTVTVSGGPPTSACCNDSISEGQSVQLSATGGTSYTWLPSYGLTCYDCPDPFASPGYTTTYTVAIATDSGCIAEELVDIWVKGCGDIFVPNAFSPNGDGENDILYVRGKCIKTMDFMVFDRWGNKVFESDNPNTGWDGVHWGMPMNTGTYVWYLKAVLLDGSTVKRKGNVTLVR